VTHAGRDRLWVWAGYFGLAAFTAFFLIRPFLDPGDAYRPRLVPGVTYAYSFLVVAAFLPYAVAAWASRRGVPTWPVAIAGVALHVIVLFAPLTQSQDLYAYLFYGKMWAVHGANPYTVLPAAIVADPWFPWMQWRDVTSVYGPLWTLLTGGVAMLSGESLAAGYIVMKAVVLAFGAACVLGIARATQLRGGSPGHNLLLGLWNPLIIVALPLGGHADVAVVAAVLWALVADRRGHPVLASLALSVGWLVKAYAGAVLLVYLLALFRRHVPTALRTGLLATGITILAWLPFWEGAATLSGLAEIGGRASASLGGQLQLLLQGPLGDDVATALVRIAGVVVVVTVMALAARRPGFTEDPWPTAAAVFLAYVAVTPWFLYWHLTGPLALAVVAGSPAIRAATLTFSGTAMLTASFGGTPWGRLMQTSLRYGIPALAGARAARRPGRGRTSPRSPHPSRS
jgi:hypothetical protein